MKKLHSLISKIVIGLLILGASAFGAEEHSFTVKNTTEETITKLHVSEDSKTWSYFEIGAGIKPGDTMTLVWDASTANQDCKQYVKAGWADGSESESAIFNFCEKNLELEF